MALPPTHQRHGISNVAGVEACATVGTVAGAVADAVAEVVVALMASALVSVVAPKPPLFLCASHHLTVHLTTSLCIALPPVRN